jgi:hypothetical protein
MNCDAYYNLPMLQLKVGTILYTGSTIENAHSIYNAALDNPIVIHNKDIFRYKGISTYQPHTYKHYVAFFSTNINTAMGYALSSTSNGWINKYIVIEDITFYNYDGYLIVEEVAECVCEDHVKAIGVVYDETNNEFAICDPWNKLNYVGTAVINKNNKISNFNNLYTII